MKEDYDYFVRLIGVFLYHYRNEAREQSDIGS